MIEKQNLVKGGRKRVIDLHFVILELETSTLACRFITRGPNEGHAQLGQMSSGRVTWPTFEFWDPSIYRGRLDLETSNFACRFFTRGINEKNAKLGQRGLRRHHWLTIEILMSHSIYWERLELERYIWQADLSLGVLTKKCTIRTNGVGMGHVTYFWNFGTHSICCERF